MEVGRRLQPRSALKHAKSCKLHSFRPLVLALLLLLLLLYPGTIAPNVPTTFQRRRRRRRRHRHPVALSTLIIGMKKRKNKISTIHAARRRFFLYLLFSSSSSSSSGRISFFLSLLPRGWNARNGSAGTEGTLAMGGANPTCNAGMTTPPPPYLHLWGKNILLEFFFRRGCKCAARFPPPNQTQSFVIRTSLYPIMYIYLSIHNAK